MRSSRFGNHRLDNNDRSSSRTSRSNSSRNQDRTTNSKDNDNDNDNDNNNISRNTAYRYNNNSNNKGNNSTKNTCLKLIIVGCAIFGYVTSYRNSKLFFHTIEYYKDNSAYFNDDAPSSPSPQQLLQLLSNNNKQQQQQKQQQPLLQLSELTRSHIQNITCPEPLFPVYDKIIKTNTNNSTFREQDEQEQEEQNNLIPKIIHLSWKSRCISQDMMEIVNKWKDQFPSYNIYIHDDSAVAALLNDNDNYWSDLFPQLQQIMTSCAKFGSAMTIDIWRILILYRFGGIYSDFDVAPDVKLTEMTIQNKNYSAFFLSDPWNRPSHWLIGMEPNHPIMYHTMLIILNNLLELKDVSQVKLVFVTGPEALKKGYATVISTGNGGEEPYKQIFDTGIHRLRKPYPNNTLVQKFKNDGYGYQNKLDKTLVPYRMPTTTNSSNSTSNTTTIMITKKERIKKETNSSHWTQIIKETKNDVPRGMCIDHLYMNAQQQKHLK